MGLSWQEIEVRLEEAAITLRRLPDPPGSGPKGAGSSWPEYVREARHAYGYQEARMRVVPTARQVSEMDEALDWLRLLSDPLDRRIVWMRVAGSRWRTIASRLGVPRTSAHRRYGAALLTLERAISRGGARRPSTEREDRAKPGRVAVADLLDGEGKAAKSSREKKSRDKSGADDA